MNGTRAANENASSITREDALVSRARLRDRRAFQELYSVYRPRLWRFLLQLTKRPALAEEVLNETMLAVWSGMERFNGDSAFSTWVFAIAYRTGLKSLKRNDEPVEDDRNAELISSDNNPEQNAADHRSSQLLQAAIARLSPEQRAVIDMTYFHEMKYREIATIMECPEDTVKTRMFHARRQLRKFLTDDQSDWI